MFVKAVGKVCELARSQNLHQAKALDELQVALAMDGDAKAFALLYRRWHPRLLRHARSLAGHSEDARDIMQDAAMAIARNIHRLKNPESFGPWAYTIVRNRAANHIKRVQRDRSAIANMRTQAGTQSNQPPITERADQLRDLISTLPISDQEVLSAYYVDGMSVSEIASCLAIPSGTIKSRLYKARAHLKSAYANLKGNDYE